MSSQTAHCAGHSAPVVVAGVRRPRSQYTQGGDIILLLYYVEVGGAVSSSGQVDHRTMATSGHCHNVMTNNGHNNNGNNNTRIISVCWQTRLVPISC
ncbi:hypothetical protein ElyMa_005236100 [Elysia marginata]|uniref:Uncharacterized protein n=1 Tax=Elysia marginata TaxID=1093978 RepID=A0AAV4K0C1_9GAST|nr:hypothetical protein ElyMa_005236100 [Elysia marginata]